MRSDADFKSLLNSLLDPTFILDSAGRILDLNVSAARIVGVGACGSDLADLISAPALEEFREFVRRCRGKASPTVGALTFAASGNRFECWGSRLTTSRGEPEIVLRLARIDQSQFSMLAKKVQELNAEIRNRRHSQARLEEALSYNQILLRELHHRAKNNIQLMIGLFSATRRETTSQDLVRFIDVATQRLLAIGATQQLMHEAAEMQLLPLPSFVESLCDAIKPGMGSHVRITSSATGGFISADAAQPLALIINELITNSAKYALRDGAVNVDISVKEENHEIILIVQDDGPGIQVQEDSTLSRRNSGLHLVRGLCRQIGGSFLIENEKGARVTVRLPGHERREDQH